jgi:hypothetical protein
MPDHLHAIVAFHNTGKTINSILGNGKRFLAYDFSRSLTKTTRTGCIDTTQ